MALLEQLVEKALCDALTTALTGVLVGRGTPAQIAVTGFLQAASGGLEKKTSRSGVLVSCRPRSRTFCSSLVTMTVTVSIRSAFEDDPEGSKIAEIADPLMALLDTWNDDPSALSTALNVADVFRADGLLTGEGDADGDTTDLLWIWTLPLTLKGARLPPAEETET